MKNSRLFVLALSAVIGTEMWFFVGPSLSNLDIPARASPTVSSFPELQELPSHIKSFTELSKFFKGLADTKGAEYAYGALRVAPLPPDTDFHLLGHVVGDELYKQKGAEGIKTCTDDFRNACSHSIVVGLFLEHGEGALSQIIRACREAPGGTGAYTMCFHGLGHGILAATGYEMPKAMEICKKTGSEKYAYREYAECVGGTVMEIVGGGFHDQKLWEKQSAKFAPKEDPLLPCTAEYMAAEARGQCYTYLTPRLFSAFGGDRGHPSQKDFADGFSLCAKVNEPGDRRACYGGFGKEFIVLAMGRDIRRMEDMGETQLSKVRDWCHLAKDPEGIRSCIISALSSLYWGGENDYHVVLRFCEVMTSDQKQACLSGLIGAVQFYERDRGVRSAVCKDLPASHKEECARKLL